MVAGWFVSTIGLFGLGIVAGGAETRGATDREDRAQLEARTAYEVFGASGQAEAPTQTVSRVIASPLGVADPAFAAAVTAAVTRLRELTVTIDGATEPVFEQVLDPLTGPPQAALVAADGTAVRIVARASAAPPHAEARVAPVGPAIEAIQAAHPAFAIHGLSGALANQQISKIVNEDLDGSLRITISLTFAILLVAFGAVAAALVRLVLAVTAILAALGLLALYSQVIYPTSPYASQLVVLIGLAVAVDYSLFMISRYRPEVRAGRQREAAIRVASATAGRAVFFSGVAVIISIAGLFLLDDPLFRSMAIATIAVVAISVAGSLTFLPAVLAVVGGRIDWGRIPYFGRPRPEGSGFWSRIVRGVTRRPVLLGGLAALLLVAVAAPALRLHLGQSDLSSFPDSVDSVRAIRLMNEKWPQGTTLALDVVVTHADLPATQAAIDRFSEAVLTIPGLSGPPRPRLSADGTVAMVSYTMAGGQNDQANRAIVRQVRTGTAPAVFSGLPDVRVYVSGDAAWTADSTAVYEGGMLQVIPFVLGLSFLLLLVAFRSVMIPIKAILLNLLSTGAAYGVMVLVFQEGVLRDVFRVQPGVIENFVPVFVFTILFGLSMDYHVLILTRVKEARDRGMPSTAAVEHGIAITSGTITSAAAIMVAVFSVFVTLQLVIIKQLGLGLAVAVFIDATIVRIVLLPASMRLLGDWNWWMPRFLRWIPAITMEAEPEFEDEPQPEPGSEPVRA
ncbi:MAG: MMPL family transporter [Chloroflexi bacterium]|nr:MMPL family transporter [Chloroflexota bacterium]